MRIIAVDGEPFTLLLSCHKMAQWRQTMYLEKYEQYLGTGERNAAGLDLKTFLEEYNPKLYDTPANTVDNLIFTYVEENGKKRIGKILLIKEEIIHLSAGGPFREDSLIFARTLILPRQESLRRRQDLRESRASSLAAMVIMTETQGQE